MRSTASKNQKFKALMFGADNLENKPPSISEICNTKCIRERFKVAPATAMCAWQKRLVMSAAEEYKYSVGEASCFSLTLPCSEIQKINERSLCADLCSQNHNAIKSWLEKMTSWTSLYVFLKTTMRSLHQNESKTFTTTFMTSTIPEGPMDQICQP
jgi:hypothetical protein